MQLRHAATAVLCSIGLFAGITACGGSDDPPASIDTTVSSLRLIGQQVLPRRVQVLGTTIGGLSGVDYDAANNRYVFISDDRTTTDSADPPRFYTGRLTFDANSFTGVEWLAVTPMKQPDGSNFPKVPSPQVADPESIRFDPVTGNLLWVSEGDRSLTAVPPRVINPFVREMRLDGTYVRDYTLPSMFNMSSSDTGPRNNTVFEGIAVTPDRTRVAVIMEGPLFQDGLPPTLTTGAVTRLTLFDRTTGQAVSQFAYPVERVQRAPVPDGSFTVNGPTEILALSATRFLVLERSFSVGVVGNQVRLYEIDTAAATNVLSTAALSGATYTAVTKRLVLDFTTLTQLAGIANLEGISFGPRLANGNRSLVVVADDNFPTADSTTDFNQILVFEVRP